MLDEMNGSKPNRQPSAHRPESTDSSFVAKLASLPLLEGLQLHLLEAIAAEFEWFSVPGGQTLFNQGDQDDSLYVVLSGRLGAFLRDAQGKETLIRQMGTGETVGEMALLSGEPRSATIIALRDAEVARLSKRSFEKLLDEHPKTLRFITDLLVRRLREPPKFDGSPLPPRTVAVFPLVSDALSSDFVRSFAKAFEQLGLKTTIVDNNAADQPIEWFNKLEDTFDMVLYQADPGSPSWNQLCLRQADRLLLLVDGTCPLRAAAFETETVFGNPRRAPIELVILRSEQSSAPLQTMSLLKRFDVPMHHHVSPQVPRDLRRLARMITGRAIGLVLSGGGARGFAHIGVIRALREAGIELDLFGGASMGAIIAAGAAMGWDDRILSDKVRLAFSEANPVSDYTFPMIALVKGRKASRAFREHFGEQQIEDTHYPYFCVSANLTTSRVNIHRTGPLWLALRATSSIPGVLPPVVQGSHILIDGGLMNNLPIDVMSEMKRGPIVAVEVSRNHGLEATIDEIDTRPVWQLLGHARHGTPNILTVLMAAGTVSSYAQERLLGSRGDLLIEPPLAGIGMLDWKAFDRAVEAGYRHAVTILEENKGALFRASAHS
jgi:NTE family protein